MATTTEGTPLDELEEWAVRLINENFDEAVDALRGNDPWLTFVDAKLFAKTGFRATPSQLDAMSRQRSTMLRRLLRNHFGLDR